MGYEEWWKTLEHLITEFRKKNMSVPKEIMTSLRSAKTMINVYKADLSRVETIPEIENYLLSVESSLINIAKEKFGQNFVNNWLRILETSRKEQQTKTDSATRFIPGLPKNEHWIRVLPSEDILKRNIERLAGELGLSFKNQKDGYVLVYGDKKKIKEFVKKMAEKCRRTLEN